MPETSTDGARVAARLLPRARRAQRLSGVTEDGTLVSLGPRGLRVFGFSEGTMPSFSTRLLFVGLCCLSTTTAFAQQYTVTDLSRGTEAHVINAKGEVWNVDDNNQVVGRSASDEAMLWDAAGAHVLPSFDASSGAFGINRGVVDLGTMCPTATGHRLGVSA
jgi:hypothetical protein